MKYYLLLTIILGNIIYSNTQDLLIEVNPQWNNYTKIYSPKHTFEPESEREIVKLHLLNAIELLKENTQQLTLSDHQLEQRNKNIEILTDYANRGLFPVNNIQADRTPVFLDGSGTHCAVGYLLKLDGEDKIIDFVTSNNNLIKILEIENEAFNSWQESSGFTMNELALIQPSYPGYHEYEREFLDIDKKAKINGAMQAFRNDMRRLESYVYGKLNSIDGVEVNNIALNKDGKWENLGFGIESEVNGMAYSDLDSIYRLFAFGKNLLSQNLESDIIIYNENESKWESTGITTDGKIENIFIRDEIAFVAGEFTKVNGTESQNLFIFNITSYEVKTFRNEFKQGIKKINENNHYYSQSPFLTLEKNGYLDNYDGNIFTKYQTNHKMLDFDGHGNGDFFYGMSHKKKQLLLKLKVRILMCKNMIFLRDRTISY